MKITAIRTGEISIPLARPFKTALRTVERVEDIVVCITAENGMVGYGEAPPTAVITGDTKGSILSAINQFIAPAILGADLLALDEVMERMHRAIKGNTSAKAAVDMALYDLWGKVLGKPLYQLLGGYRQELETDLTISVGETAQMVADSLAAVKEGYRILKIKVGKEGMADLPRIAAIREAVGPEIRLRVDANQGWNVPDSIRIISAMEDKGLDIDLVEQPVEAHDLAGMARITQAVYTPILADESVFSPLDALEIIRRGAAGLINIKLMKTGGIHQAIKICHIASLYGVECMMGCMLESKLAVSAAAHLAAAQGIVTRADLDGPSLCSLDPFTGGPDYTGPAIRMNDLPGIGITGLPCQFS